MMIYTEPEVSWETRDIDLELRPELEVKYKARHGDPLPQGLADALDIIFADPSNIEWMAQL